jgi:hypothetical protein
MPAGLTSTTSDVGFNSFFDSPFFDLPFLTVVSSSCVCSKVLITEFIFATASGLFGVFG